ncbi:4Fe-4S dicluster domain-containing protein [bacterium]|nr:4Fe-4S dicluster domain-containing protein [bacterium]
MNEKITSQKVIVLNLDYCIGCRSCASACTESHYQHLNLVHGQVGELAVLPHHCRHCQQAACVAACPTQALEQDENGVVLRHNSLCVGCRSCVYACPFGVLDEELLQHISAKCDLCVDRTSQGLEPRCVATCVSGALTFEDLSEVWEEGRLQVGSRIISRSPWKRA